MAQNAPARNVLEVNDLAIRFGRTEIFSGLSFTVPEGAALAIIGPNGSGKTVLLRALIGAIPFEGTWTNRAKSA